DRVLCATARRADADANVPARPRRRACGDAGRSRPGGSAGSRDQPPLVRLEHGARLLAGAIVVGARAGRGCGAAGRNRARAADAAAGRRRRAARGVTEMSTARLATVLALAWLGGCGDIAPDGRSPDPEAAQTSGGRAGVDP